MSHSLRKPPNILLLMTDQQRVDTIGAYGSTVCRTPNIDRLAKEGVRFTNAFTPCALCSPARASFLSGTYPHEHGVLTNVSLHPVRQSLSPKQDILTPAIKNAGYKAGYVGKWHVNNELTPVDFGFDDYISLADYDRWRLNEGLEIPAASSDYSSGLPADGVDPVPVEKCRDAWQCDRAMELMARYREAGNPFFVRIDFHGPHAPLVIPEPYKSMYEKADIREWPNFSDDLHNKPMVQRAKRELYKTEHTTWDQWRPKVASYFGEVSLIDAQIGRVLDFLDEQGMTENTLVIFTTDHGDTFGAHRMRNKDYVMYEEVYRVPLIARWPGIIEADRKSEAYTHHVVDLCASLLDIIGQNVPSTAHGRSLLPIFRGREPDSWPRSAYSQAHGCHYGLYTQRAIRTDTHRYVYHPFDTDELYDRIEDPHELNNLSNDPSQEKILTDLRYLLVEWMKETQDHLYNEWNVSYLTGDAELAAQAPSRRTTPW